MNEYKKLKFKDGISIHTFFIMLYFLLVPMEDILNNSAGSVVKYIAILIIAVGISENKGKIIINFNSENKCIIILIIISILSVIWSINREITMHRIISYTLIPAFCLYVNTLNFNKKEFELIVKSIIAGGIIAALIAIKSGNVLNESIATRMILTEGNDPNSFASFLLLPVSLCWWRIQENDKRLSKTIYLLLFVFLSIVILLTGSRGALLSIVIMIVVYYFGSGKIKKASALLGGAFLILILFIVLRKYIPSDLLDRLFNLSNYTLGGAGRTTVWGIVIKNIIPHMGILGLGAGCASLKLTSFYGFAKGVHNTYLNMICEYGLLGIPVFILFISILFKKNIRKKYYFGVALLACICTTIFFLDSYAKKYFWNVILFLFIYDNVFETDVM